MKNIHSVLLAVFFGLVCVFFFKTFFGKLPVPSDSLVGLYHPWRDFYANEFPRGIPFKNFLITDPVRQQIPWRFVAVRQWQEGAVPGWNPYSFSGTSLRGNIQAGAFYPLNILFLFFSFPYAWTILIVLQPLLAGLFLYAYLRSRRLHPAACFIGAICWSFSGFTIAWLTWGTIVHTALWLPLSLLSIDGILLPSPSKKGKRMWMILLAVSWSFSFLAGHAQIFLYCFVASLGYAGYRLSRFSGRMVRNVTSIAFAFIAFLFLTSVQWVSFLQAVLQSSRFVAGDWQKEGFFLPFEHLVQFLVPDFFGNPTTLNYWGTWNYGEFIGFIGSIPLMFALLGAISINRRPRVFLLSSLGFLLLMMLPTPVALIPYRLQIPVIATLQPTRLMVLLVFALVLFASYGVHTWLTENKRQYGRVTGAFFLVYVLLWGVVFGGRGAIVDEQMLGNLSVALRNLVLPTGMMLSGVVLLFFSSRVRKRRVVHVLFVVVVSLTAIDLFRFGWKFTPFTDKDLFFPQTKVLSFLASQPRPFRVMSVDDRVLPPNTATYYGIEQIEGYDPIYQATYEKFIAAAGRGVPDISPPYGFNRIMTLKRIDPVFLQLLNVRYVLSLSEISHPDFIHVLSEGDTHVYEFMGALPRVFFAHSVVPFISEEQTIQELFYTGYSPTGLAIVEGSDTIRVGIPSEGDSVRITDYRDQSLTFDVTTAEDRFIVVSTQFDPGWAAYVDGERTRVYRTDMVIIGVVVPAGTHTVQLRFN